MVLNVVILSVAKDLLRVNPKDNVANLVIARRDLLDMAISFAQCVILSVAKDLAGCANILWFGDLEILHFVQNDSA